VRGRERGKGRGRASPQDKKTDFAHAGRSD